MPGPSELREEGMREGVLIAMCLFAPKVGVSEDLSLATQSCSEKSCRFIFNSNIKMQNCSSQLLQKIFQYAPSMFSLDSVSCSRRQYIEVDCTAESGPDAALTAGNLYRIEHCNQTCGSCSEPDSSSGLLVTLCPRKRALCDALVCTDMKLERSIP